MVWVKFRLVLLKTRTINFHVYETFGCALILEQDDVSSHCIFSQPLNASKQHGYRHYALVETYNVALSLMRDHCVALNAIQ